MAIYSIWPLTALRNQQYKYIHTMHTISRHLTYKRGRKKENENSISVSTQTVPINNSKGNNRAPSYPPTLLPHSRPLHKKKRKRIERKKKWNKNTTKQRVSKSVTQLRDTRAYLPRSESRYQRAEFSPIFRT